MERTTPTCAIKVVDIVGHAPNCEKLVGTYVKEIGDIDAPRTWTFTRTIERAQHFELSEALALYNTQSVMYPLRDDGKPNRPLTHRPLRSPLALPLPLRPPKAVHLYALAERSAARPQHANTRDRAAQHVVTRAALPWLVGERGMAMRETACTLPSVSTLPLAFSGATRARV
jgi:hypothetical protein